MFSSKLTKTFFFFNALKNKKALGGKKKTLIVQRLNEIGMSSTMEEK